MKLTKQAGKFMVFLPSEISDSLELREGDEVDFYEVKKGVFVFSTKKEIARIFGSIVEKELPTQKAREPQTSQLSSDELALLKKLNNYKFEERIPERVNSTLSQKEKETLARLIGKELVNIYYGGKYKKTGVYNISRRIYPLLKNVLSQPTKPLAEKPISNPLDFLEAEGYVVIEGEREAREISAKLEKRIKAREILGTRGFDRKFYVASARFFRALHEKILPILQAGDGFSESISAKLSERETACRTVLMLMADEGEVIEKKRGLFELVG
ncbi:MAG: hypothetical protein ABIH99_02485 [Candidatus Micrarchaeota archaeon]